MKLLCFQAKYFRWKTHSKTLAQVADQDVEEQIVDAVVVFVHAEQSDEEAVKKNSLLRQTLKHVKWLANKRNLKNIVIHSFTHLGGETSSPDFAESFINALAQRLREVFLSGLDDALRLFLRVGSQRLRRKLGQGLERDPLTP